MAKEIAVFIGADGSSASLDEPGRVVVFRRAQGSWHIDREKEFSMGQASGMRELRLKMSEILSLMDGCRIFVARSAAGVPFFELQKAGCGVWEYTGTPASFLEQVWDQEEGEKASVKTQAHIGIPAPQEKTPGNFYISLVEVQKNNAEVSSKQVLQQFIRRGNFKTLTIVCGHVPPWIEAEAIARGLAFEAEQIKSKEVNVRLGK